MFIRSHQEHAQGSYLGSVLHASAAAVRRLAVRNQRLDGRRRASTANALLETVRALRCLQLDPTAVVARSHLLVLYSRHGAFDEALLDRLAYRDRALFEYWAHEASLVLSEDLPIHRYEMRSWPRGGAAWPRKLTAWYGAETEFRAHILERLQAEGALRARDIDDRSAAEWEATRWNNGRNVGRLLEIMWVRGEVGIARREGAARVWDLMGRCLPPDVPDEPLSPLEVTRRAAPLAIRALGAARSVHIRAHFTRNRYPELERALEELAAAASETSSRRRPLPSSKEQSRPGHLLVVQGGRVGLARRHARIHPTASARVSVGRAPAPDEQRASALGGPTRLLGTRSSRRKRRRRSCSARTYAPRVPRWRPARGGAPRATCDAVANHEALIRCSHVSPLSCVPAPLRTGGDPRWSERRQPEHFDGSRARPGFSAARSGRPASRITGTTRRSSRCLRVPMRGHGRLSAGSTHLGTVCCVARRRGLRLRNGRQRGAPIRVVTALAFRAQAGAEALAFARLPWTTTARLERAVRTLASRGRGGRRCARAGVAQSLRPALADIIGARRMWSTTSARHEIRSHSFPYEARSRFKTGQHRPPNAWFAQAHRCGPGYELEAKTLAAALRCRRDAPWRERPFAPSGPDAFVPTLVDELQARAFDSILRSSSARTSTRCRSTT
jgi:hypothetical protein